MNSPAILLEVCANSLDSAINAAQAGAQRIELCSALELGGLTPSAATLRLTRQQTALDIFVLIRPRAGDFCYSDQEWAVIREDILQSKSLGADGIVGGALLADGTIDLERTQEMIALSNPLPFTFHRAFDRVVDPILALQQLIELGAKRILTSGQAANAMGGKKMLKKLVELAGEDITILGGAGIKSKNVKTLVMETGLREVHLSGKKKIERLGKVSAIQFNQNSGEEDSYFVTDVEEIRKVMTVLATCV